MKYIQWSAHGRFFAINRQKIINNSSDIESNLALILDSLPDLYFRLNFAGIILDQKSGLPKDLYLPREKFLGKSMYDVLPSDVSQTFRNALTTISQGEKSLVTIEYALPMSEGLQYFEANLNVFQEDQVIVLVRNITDRKLLKKKLLQLDAPKLVSETLAALVHEIRNPMTSIKGFLQLLKTKSNANMEYFDIIFEELDSINKILSEFILLAKNKTVDLKSENINTIINTMVPLLKANAKLKNQYLHIELGDVPKILLDQNQIRRLIINITNNGFEAMAAGGHLYLKTALTDQQVILEIRDEGPGIKPELLDKIGTPFFTTKEKGTGLGLAICCHIAARHKAPLKVNSTASGTAFTIHFPINYNNR